MVFNAGGKVKYGAFIPLDFDESKEVIIPIPRKERIINGLKDIRDALYSEYPENYMKHYESIIHDAIDYIENFEGGESMKISQKGLNLIKEYEGCRLSAYKDSVGVVTIGWGTTNADSSIIGTKIYMGMKITQAQADEWLEKSVNNKYVPKVMKYDSVYHWNQNQLDALTSFAYNIGSIDQLTNYGKRTITEIANKILAYNKAGGKVLDGLTRRRKAEKILFETPVKQIQLKGWVYDSKGWWYKLEEGYYKDGWYEIDNNWYYFKEDGYMANDEFVKSSDYDTNKKLYWVSTDGAWNGKTYYWKQDTIGWWITDGKGYFPKSMWHKIDGNWYYFNEKGYMVTGKQTINGKDYVFRADGTLVE